MKNCFKATVAALAATAALTAMSGAARADLNNFGEVGLPLNPTAQIPEQGGARIQGNYNELYDANVGGLGNAEGKQYSIVGAFRAGNNIEVSGGVHQFKFKSNFGGVGNDDDQTGFGLNAKYLITRESDPAKVRMAAGLGFLEADDFSTQRAYFVASKSLNATAVGRTPITGHLGLRYDRFKLDGGLGDDSSSRFSAFAGAEVPITANGQFQFVGEVGTKQVDGGELPYSLSLRYRPAQKPFGISAGVARQGAFSAIDDGSQLFVQIGYTFGK